MNAMTLSYIIWNPDVELLDLGFFALRWYSLCFMAAFVASYIILKKQFVKEGQRLDLLDNLTIYVGAGTICGARLGHCLFYDFDYYRHHLLEIILPVQFSPAFKIIGYQGLASHGGAIGILIAIYIFSRVYKLNYWWIADKLALVVPLAGCFIRLGNLMNSEIIGKPSHVSWAFIFVREDNLPRHPAQLYEAVSYLLIFGIIFLLFRKTTRQPGFIFGCFLTLLFTARFVIEFCKEDQSLFEHGWPLNMGQWLSIPLIIAGIFLAFNRRGRIFANNEQATPNPKGKFVVIKNEVSSYEE